LRLIPSQTNPSEILTLSLTPYWYWWSGTTISTSESESESEKVSELVGVVFRGRGCRAKIFHTFQNLFTLERKKSFIQNTMAGRDGAMLPPTGTGGAPGPIGQGNRAQQLAHPDYKLIHTQLVEFFKTFTEEGIDEEMMRELEMDQTPKYMTQLQEISNKRSKILSIDVDDIVSVRAVVKSFEGLTFLVCSSMRILPSFLNRMLEDL
jgi:hypothetical protein